MDNLNKLELSVSECNILSTYLRSQWLGYENDNIWIVLRKIESFLDEQNKKECDLDHEAMQLEVSEKKIKGAVCPACDFKFD